MSSTQIGLRRAAAVAVAIVLLSAVVVVPTAAATSHVSGSLTFRERIALTPTSVAIVTIIDNTAAADAGVIIGQQVINGPTAVPIDFAVLVEDSSIVPTHSYSLYATIIDGASTWHNPVGEPVITGGPTKGIDLTLTAVPQAPGGAVSGKIVLPSGTTLKPGGVLIAALVNVKGRSSPGPSVRRPTPPISASRSATTRRSSTPMRPTWSRVASSTGPRSTATAMASARSRRLPRRRRSTCR